MIIRNMKLNRLIKNVSLIVFVFMFIYNPPFLPFSVLYLLMAISWVWIFFHIRAVFAFWSKRENFKLLFFIFFMLLYILVIGLINSSIRETSSLIIIEWVVILFPICHMVTEKLKDSSMSFDTFIEMLFKVANIQGGFSLFALLNKDFQQWFLAKGVELGWELERFTVLSNYRMCGFAMHLTNFAPMVSAVLVVLALFYARDKVTYILYIPLMLLTVLLNSRSSLALVVIGCICLTLLEGRNVNKLFKNFFFLFLIALIGMTAVYLVMQSLQNNWMRTWIIEGIEQIKNFLLRGDTSSGYFGYLTNPEKYVLPNGDIQKIFGVGRNIINGSPEGVSSDIGYINYIWMGGVIYLIFTFILIWLLIKPLTCSGDNNQKRLSQMLVVTFMVLSFKDTLLGLNEYISFVLLCSVFARKIGREKL